MILENEPIHTVKLYGKMRQKFGKEIKLAGHSAAAVLRGFALQNKEFGEALVHGFFYVLRGENIKSAISYREEEIGAEIGSQSQVFHLIPAAAGAKSGIFNIIAGVVIMVAAIVASPFTGGASFGAAMGATAFWGISYGALAMFGLGLTLIGVSQMTAKTPKMDTTREEDNASSVISGPQNTAKQGAAVPLAYGKVLTGSVLVASNLTAIDYSWGLATSTTASVVLPISGETYIPFNHYFTKVTKISVVTFNPRVTATVVFDYDTTKPKGFTIRTSGKSIWFDKILVRWKAEGWK